MNFAPMTAASAMTTSIMTMTIPMVSRFTPPASCSSSWTYEPEAANAVPGGLIVQNAATADHVDSACWPSGFYHYGRVQPTQRFSPGWCPSGYTSADKAINRGVTSAACCLSGYSYASSVDGPNGIYAGCLSMLQSDSSTILTVRQETSASTEIVGPVTIWGQPILIAMESSDLSLFVPATTTTSLSSMSPAQTSTSHVSSSGSSSTPSSSSASSSFTTQSSSTQSTLSPTSAPGTITSGLSSGTKAGIGIGAGVGVLGIIALIAAIFIFRRRRKHPVPQDHLAPASQQRYYGAPVSQSNQYPKIGKDFLPSLE
ncbi:hypothetical protein N7539_000596 [Penicillium diatomitis]|uniref:Uncharacterized protein n=1 Tax=Penicillium diatomitis TaxID=2819901 RepID=A0A9W9XMU8_9EURO|nr:uncharacterized protein N7539_000596 [Penicillium diatomitis]KAJ5495480.1 hypothetical protein N7539_000596 [Penicillium diatomitis]